MPSNNAGDPRESRIRWTFGLVGAGAFAALLGLEIASENGPVSTLKLLLEALELALTLAAAAGFTLLAGRLRAQHEERLALMRDLEVARMEGQTWRARAQAHLDGLGAAIGQQFDAWQLTGAEGEVAMLMIKGFSHKEIGSLRHTAEATVRQQARSIYDKAGLAGRTALSAYFLEDLLTAAAPAAAPAAAGATAARHAPSQAALAPRSQA
jgi:DNA-binding CsgD family transcriptional regulator